MRQQMTKYLSHSLSYQTIDGLIANLLCHNRERSQTLLYVEYIKY